MALIYLVEDDRNIREIERIALQNSGHQVKEFECAKDFFAALATERPDLLLLDVMLPDADGLDVVETIRSDVSVSRLPVIMVTARSAEIDKVKGLDRGADDYLTKPFGVMELISRVKALLRRTGQQAADEMIVFGKVCLNEKKHCVTVSDVLCELTYKEYELLKLLMTNAGRVSTRDEILDKVWGTDFEGESRTLDMHIKTLRQKLGEAGGMIKTVRNVGYIFNT